MGTVLTRPIWHPAKFVLSPPFSMKIQIDYTPHPRQLMLHEDKHRYKVVVCGRRFGKTTFAIFELLSKALEKPQPFPYWYVAPTYRQAKEIAWKNLLKTIPRDIRKKTNETELKIWLVNGAEIALKGADNEDCYSDDTELLTDKGWRLFKNLDKTEKILTLNPSTLTTEWQKPSNYIEEDYEGNFYSVKSKKIDLLISPNHKFFIQSRKGRLKFKTPNEFSFNDAIPLALGSRLLRTTLYGQEHWKAALLGIYLSEGTAYGNSGGDIKKRNGNYSVFIAQADGLKGYKNSKGDVKEKIKTLLTNLGYKFRDRGDGLEVLNKELWTEFIKLGNKYSKFIPNKYKNLSPDKLEVLLEWLILGDGSIDGKHRCYYTVSKKLADDVQEIAFKAGYSANIVIKKPSKSGFMKGREIRSIVPLYQVTIYQNKRVYLRDTKESYVKETNYFGRMYCVEVPNHTILVRRNGKAIWCGNSLRGAGLNGVVLDEYAQVKSHVWGEIIRPMLTDTEGWAIFIGTPQGYDNDLFKKYEEEKRDPDYKSFHFTSYENPYVPTKDIDKAKEELTEDAFAQEYLAEFKRFTGLVYKDFSREVHVVKPFDIQPSWTWIRGLDRGFRNPSACMFIAVSDNDVWYLVDSVYQAGLTNPELHELIKQKSGGHFFSWSVGDSEDPASLKDLSDLGSYFQPVEKTSGTSGLNWIRYKIEKFTARIKEKKFFVFDTPANRLVIKEFENYRWQEKKDESVDPREVPVKKDDHAMDALGDLNAMYIKDEKESLPVDNRSWRFD